MISMKTINMKNIYTCDIKSCGLYLEEPIALPCGYSICKNHIDKNKDIFECESCGKEHPIDEDGLKVNLKTASFIQMNLHLTDEHKQVKEVFDQLSKNILDFKQSKLSNGENFVNNYFYELRNQLDIHREKSIEQINKKYNEIIGELKDLEKEYDQNRKKLKFEVDKFIKPEWETVLRTPNLLSEQLTQLKVDINAELEEFNKNVKLYENDLLMNKKLAFVPSNETSFGELTQISHKIVYHNDWYYVGEWSNEKANGKGACFWKNGKVYQGEWKDQEFDGKGKLIIKKDDGKVHGYEGEWKKGLKNGQGVEHFPDGNQYTGDYVDDKFDGNGKLITANYTYEGAWKEGKMNGYGVLYYSNGDTHEINHKLGVRSGKAKHIFRDGYVLNEKWINGRRDIIYSFVHSFRCAQVN